VNKSPKTFDLVSNVGIHTAPIVLLPINVPNFTLKTHFPAFGALDCKHEHRM
jgi:hypothetical protein